MTTAALATVGALGAAFRGQSRAEREPRPAAPGTSTALILSSPNPRIAKIALRNAQEERLLHILTQPELIGLATVFGGLFLANKIPFAGQEPQNSAIQSVAATSAVLMGLGHAGVGDLTSLTMATMGGAATFVTGIGGGENGGGWFGNLQDMLDFITNPLNKILGWFGVPTL